MPNMNGTCMPDVTHITACRLCDSPDLELVVSFTPTPIGDHYVTADKWNEPQPCYPLDVLTCKACGAVQLADTVDPKLIYPDTYLYTTSVSKGLDEHFRWYAVNVLDRCRAGGKYVIDIGSNDGTLLWNFQACGCRVLGIDPSKDAAAKAEADGVKTHVGFFSEALGKSLGSQEQADVITANHVFANVADLHDFTRGVKHLLAPDGTFVFETGYWPAIVENNLIDTIEHEHIQYFAVKPLKRFFRRHGLQLVHAEVNHAKGGSLRGYVQHEGYNDADASVLLLHALEDQLSIGAWAKNLKEIEHYMRGCVAASEGEKWVGYGAAVGSTLLLYQFGLGEKLRCLVDANPQKQGRLSPGYHLPVFDPKGLAAINPDKIVILAWRYAQMIQAQHPEFAGRFILPLPEVVTA
jgi:SAM-dependent methyltransferase